MELRKCECGSDVIYIDPRHGWVVFCHECNVETIGENATVEQAIQAWNEGKVE